MLFATNTILRQSNPLESPIASHCHHYSSPHALYKKTFAESPVSILSFVTVNQHNSVHLSSYFWCSIPTASIPLSWPPYTAIIKTGMLYPIDNLLFLLHIESVSLPTFSWATATHSFSLLPPPLLQSLLAPPGIQHSWDTTSPSRTRTAASKASNDTILYY